MNSFFVEASITVIGTLPEVKVKPTAASTAQRKKKATFDRVGTRMDAGLERV